MALLLLGLEDLLQPGVHGGQAAGGELVSLEAPHDPLGLRSVAAPVCGAVAPVMFRPEVVPDLVSDRVDRLVVIVRVDFAPGQVTVALADSIEIAQTFHAANVSVEQKVNQAVVPGVAHSEERVQQDLNKVVKYPKYLNVFTCLFKQPGR